MITNIWRKAFRAYFGGNDANIQAFDVTGATRTISRNASNGQGLLASLAMDTGLLKSLNTSNAGVAFGTGTTPPSVDDYKLSGDHITSFSAESSTYLVTISGNKHTYAKTYFLKNTGSAAFTINEVAWMARLGNYTFLCDRTLLDNPVTIQPGESGAVTYKISIEMPDA